MTCNTKSSKSSPSQTPFADSVAVARPATAVRDIPGVTALDAFKAAEGVAQHAAQIATLADSSDFARKARLAASCYAHAARIAVALTDNAPPADFIWAARRAAECFNRAAEWTVDAERAVGDGK